MGLVVITLKSGRVHTDVFQKILASLELSEDPQAQAHILVWQCFIRAAAFSECIMDFCFVIFTTTTSALFHLTFISCQNFLGIGGKRSF